MICSCGLVLILLADFLVIACSWLPVTISNDYAPATLSLGFGLAKTIQDCLLNVWYNSLKCDESDNQLIKNE